MVAWSPTGVSVSRGVKRERTKFREGWARYPVDGRQRGEGVEVRFIPRGRENGPGTSFCQTLNGGDQSSGHFRPWWGVCPVPLPRVLARRIYTPPAPQYAGPPEGRGTASLGPTCLSPRCVQNWPGAGSVGPVVVAPRMRSVAVSQGSSLALPPWPPVLNRLAVQPLSAGGGGGGGDVPLPRLPDPPSILRGAWWGHSTPGQVLVAGRWGPATGARSGVPPALRGPGGWQRGGSVPFCTCRGQVSLRDVGPWSSGVKLRARAAPGSSGHTPCLPCSHPFCVRLLALCKEEIRKSKDVQKLRSSVAV